MGLKMHDHFRHLLAGSSNAPPHEELDHFLEAEHYEKEGGILNDVSIVVITRNREEKFRKCIESILRDAGNSSEIIVVDDASERDYTSSLSSTIKVIRNKKRKLLSESRNIGARSAKNNYIFFVDDDNVVEKGTIATLARTLASMNEVAVACPLTVDKHDEVWSTFGKVGKFSGFVSFNYRGYKPAQVQLGIKEVKTFHNCFMFKKELFFKFGGFDSVNFPMYLAELDLAEKIRKQGYKIIVNTACKVIHDIDYGVFRNVHITEPVRAYMVSRNRILYMRRHRSNIVFVLFLLLFQPVYFFIHLYLILTSGKKSKEKNRLIGAYLRGMLDGIISRAKYGIKLMEQSNIEFKQAS